VLAAGDARSNFVADDGEVPLRVEVGVVTGFEPLLADLLVVRRVVVVEAPDLLGASGSSPMSRME
jgi:hypothetical protein